jgi:hypothetical protein
MARSSTWTKKRIVIIVSISIVYGIWFNYLDAAAYCPPNPDGKCIPVGKILGDNKYYQPWNIIGHAIPALLLLTLFPKKTELFLASILISSAVMDSPLWGVMRLAHGLPLWHIAEGVNFVPTTIDLNGLWQWIVYYYNPIGAYPVWADNWPEGSGLPNAALIFWSVALRVVFAMALILWQKKQEAEGKEFSLNNIILLRKYRKKKIK